MYMFDLLDIQLYASNILASACLYFKKSNSQLLQTFLYFQKFGCQTLDFWQQIMCKEITFLSYYQI